MGKKIMFIMVDMQLHNPTEKKSYKLSNYSQHLVHK